MPSFAHDIVPDLQSAPIARRRDPRRAAGHLAAGLHGGPPRPRLRQRGRDGEAAPRSGRPAVPPGRARGRRRAND